MRQPLSVTAAAVAALLAIASGAPSTKPNLLMILQDDLGHWNVGFNSQRSAMPSADVAAVSPNLMALAKEGVILDRHYVHWHCSPTRRTFLTGRTPLHHGEQLSDPQTADHIDLRWSTIGHKLKAQGYETHWYGKGHTGYKSYNHLPKQLGFDSFIGFLGGAEAFTGYNRWRDNSPMCALQTAAAAGAAPASASSSPSSTAPAPPACTITKGVYFVGDATQHLASASDAECCAACQKDESCTAWTRDSSEPATRNCLFKPQSTKSRPEAAASSGTTFPPGPAPPGCGTAGHAPRLPTDAEYSALLYGDAAAASVKAHDVSKPLFMYLPWQSTHQPYTYAPGWNLTTADGRHKCDGMVRGASNNGVGNGMAEPECILYGMVWKTDLAVGNIVKELKAKGMWANTLIAYSADNGGVTDSVNFPLRGEKHTNWEGGVRGASFISGGLVPANVRGTINSIVFSVSDWYATFAVLGGASPRDDPKVPPLPVDPANRLKDIYGNFSFPSVDGVNIWPMLTHPERFNVSSAHKYLWVSHEVLIAGDYKLLLAQPQAKATTFNPTFQNIKFTSNGWKYPNGSWMGCNATYSVKSPEGCSAGHEHDNEVYGCNQYQRDGHDDLTFRPCLFKVSTDFREKDDLSKSAAGEAMVSQLWGVLNRSTLEYFNGSRSPPNLLGYCNANCSTRLWSLLKGANEKGPECGLPGMVEGQPCPVQADADAYEGNLGWQ